MRSSMRAASIARLPARRHAAERASRRIKPPEPLARFRPPALYPAIGSHQAGGGGGAHDGRCYPEEGARRGPRDAVLNAIAVVSTTVAIDRVLFCMSVSDTTLSAGCGERRTCCVSLALAKNAKSAAKSRSMERPAADRRIAALAGHLHDVGSAGSPLGLQCCAQSVGVEFAVPKGQSVALPERLADGEFNVYRRAIFTLNFRHS